MSLVVLMEKYIFSISVYSAIVSFVSFTTLATLLSIDYNFVSETISGLGKSNQKYEYCLCKKIKNWGKKL